MNGPLFLAPGEGCLRCREIQERAETYRARMKATDRRIAALTAELDLVKAELERAEAALL